MGADPPQKGGITPVPQSLGEVEFCKGVKRSGTIPKPFSRDGAHKVCVDGQKYQILSNFLHNGYTDVYTNVFFGILNG